MSASDPIPVIAPTALPMKADLEKSQITGCDAHIAKALRCKELYAAIEALFAKVRAIRVMCVSYSHRRLWHRLVLVLVPPFAR